MNPIISVILPNFNHADFLHQRLDSIFNQTFQDFEVIILDDASTDNSLEILKAYKNHSKVTHFIVNQINSGSPFIQWQKGIDIAIGKYIWIAESDDYCENNFLETVLSRFSANVKLCYVNSIDIDDNDHHLSNRLEYTNDFALNIWNNDFTIDGETFIEKYLLFKNVIPNASAVVFEKKIIRQSIFNTDFNKMRMCGDWLFWITICKGTTISYTKESCNYFRSHIDSSRNHDTIAIKKTRLLEEKVIRKHVYRELGYKDCNAQKIMLQKWMALHSKKAILKKDFYKVVVYERMIFQFVFIYIKSYFN